MNSNIFLYKFLLNLYNKGVKEFSIFDLEKFCLYFIPLLYSYNYGNFAKKFNKSNKFIINTLLIFSKFEWGVYKNKTLYFYDDPIIIDALANYQLDISDNIISEISMYFSLYLNDINNPKQK